MAHIYREVHYNDHHHTVVSSLLAGIVAAAGGFITLLLATRFILTLANVDRLTEFASFIYSASYPFVAPFFTLFNYQPQTGIARFEFHTLVAIAFWAFMTWFIARLITFSDKVD